MSIYSLIQNHVERQFVRQKSAAWSDQYYNYMNPQSLLQDMKRKIPPGILILDERFNNNMNEGGGSPLTELLEQMVNHKLVVPNMILILNDDRLLDKGDERSVDRAIGYFKLGVNDFIQRPISSEELSDHLSMIYQKIYHMESLVHMTNLARQLWMLKRHSDFLAVLKTLHEQFGPSPYLQVLQIEVLRAQGGYAEAVAAAHEVGEMLPESVIAREGLALALIEGGQREQGFQEYAQVCRRRMTRARAEFLAKLTAGEDGKTVDPDEVMAALQLFSHHTQTVGPELRKVLLNNFVNQAQTRQDAEFFLDLLDFNLDLREEMAKSLIGLQKFWPPSDEIIRQQAAGQLAEEERVAFIRLLYYTLGSAEPRPLELVCWVRLQLAAGKVSEIEEELLGLRDRYAKVPEWYYCMASVQLKGQNFSAASTTNMAGLRQFHEHPLLLQFKKEWQAAYDHYQTQKAG